MNIILIVLAFHGSLDYIPDIGRSHIKDSGSDEDSKDNEKYYITYFVIASTLSLGLVLDLLGNLSKSIVVFLDICDLRGIIEHGHRSIL